MPVSALRPRPVERRADRVCRLTPLPNGASRREYYDYLGRLHTAEEPDGARLHCVYDAEGQLREVQNDSGTVASYSGRQARTDRTETIIGVDDAGMPRDLVQRVDGFEWRVGFQWSEAGRPTGLLYPQAADWLRMERRGPSLEVSCAGRTHLTAHAGARFSTGAATLEEFGPPLRRVTHTDSAGTPVLDIAYTYDDAGRVIRAGSETYEYDARGRLARFESPTAAWEAPAAYGLPGCAFDASGRRVRSGSGEDATVYEYDSFGQLAAVYLPGGEVVRYLYDGYGRLVAREDSSGATYFIADLRGRRLAEAGANGVVRYSFLWLGQQCVARVEGSFERPISSTYHRAHAGKLLASGDAAGCLTLRSADHPFGAGVPIENSVPGYASLFGDPATGLLHAGSRWFDPAAAHFLTPDSWYGRDPAQTLPRSMRTVARVMPGGPNGEITAEDAYAWCGYDPVNFTDPSGHSGIGLFLCTISALLWETQLTSISLEMEVINIAWELIQLVIFREAWDNKGWWSTSIFNGNLPMASNRLNVPFALPLNGLLRVNDRAWTLGSVIWVRGDKWRNVDKSGKRSLLVCANASDYVSASQAVAADVYRTRSPFAKGTATATAASDQLTGVTVTAPAAPPAVSTDVFELDNYVYIAKTGGGPSEIRKVTFPGATITVGAALPATLAGPVDLERLNVAILKISKDDSLIARSVTFIRGTAVHFAHQLPEDFPVDGLSVAEYLPSGKRNVVRATTSAEYAVIRTAVAADRDLYAAADFVRVRSGFKYFARTIERKRGARILILDESLPKPTPPDSYKTVEIVKLTSDGAAAAAQTGAADRVNAGNLTALRKFDGLAIQDAAAAPVTVRRIVLSMLVDCQFAALPANLQGANVQVDLMEVDASKTADGSKTAASEITIPAGKDGTFSKDQWVRVRKAPSTDAFSTVTALDKDDKKATLKLTLADALAAADFPDGTAVTVTALSAGRGLDAEKVAGPAGDHIKIKTDDPSERHADDLLRVALRSDASKAAVRKIAAAPVVVAVLDSNLPATHTANLSVQRFKPDANTLKANVATPQVQLKFTVTGGAAVPFVAGDTVYLSSGKDEAWGTILAAPVGQDLILTDPIEYLLTSPLQMQSITATGVVTDGATIDESRVLIPSDPDAAPLTHREAFEQHEMRHVFQGAEWGPFLLSMPLPWLVSLGFSPTKFGPDVSNITRYCGIGGLDTAVAAAVWGMEGKKSPVDLTGALGVDLKTITFPKDTPADKLAEFGGSTAVLGTPVTVSKGDASIYNVVDELNADAPSIKLRFALDSDGFKANDSVGAHVSPFEKVRKQVSAVVNLNLSALWADRIPVHWGRVLNSILNRDSWFPGLGIYPLSLITAGGNEDRLPNEQDAAFHSGDLYSSILISRPNTIFVGQFAAIFAFIQHRNGDVVVEISQLNTLELLRVQLPAGGTASQVAGAVDSTSAGQVRFRENYYIQMSEKVENVVGAFFAASAPGDYVLRAPLELPPGTDIVFTGAFDVGFLKSRTINVQALTVAPATDAANPVFETEVVQFKFSSKDDTAVYGLRYKGAAPAVPAALDGLKFTAPLLGAAANAVHDLEITATYPEDHPVFHGPGQLPNIQLTADQRTNLCQALQVNIAPITVTNPGPLKAGAKANFNSSLPPVTVRVTSPLPAGAAMPARVIPGAKRGAPNVFFAPNKVTAASNVTLELVYGAGANQKVVPLTVVVNP